MTFEDFLSERYVNAFKIDDKDQYKDEVFKLLTDSYASIGGLKGNGFRDADDMVKSIPMWKMVRRGDKIVAVAMYKDKNGRKRVAVGSDGTEQGKAGVASIFKEDFSRAHFEISERSLGFHVKLLGYDHIKSFAIKPDKVSETTGEEIRFPVDADDVEVKRHPQLKEFFYQRKVGAHWHTKILLGTPGKKIVNFE